MHIMECGNSIVIVQFFMKNTIVILYVHFQLKHDWKINKLDNSRNWLFNCDGLSLLCSYKIIILNTIKF